MDFKVIWSERARCDLREIVSFIAHDNPSAAAKLGNELIDHTQMLSSFPFIGPKYPKGAAGTERMIVCRNYLIFYTVDETMKQVDVQTVRHGARERPKPR